MDERDVSGRSGDAGREQRWRRIVVFEPLEVDGELAALGLDRRELLEVIDGAKWGRNNTTEWDPPGYAGWNQYGLGTRYLRMVLIENRPEKHRWTMDNSGGLCRTISPKGDMAIVVSSGSPDTGDPNRWPKTLNPKGELSLRGLRTNKSQRELFESDAEVDDPWLWFLLIHVDGAEVFAELSLPLDVDESFRVDDWLKRIIIRPDSPPDDGARRVDDNLDIDVVPRAG